MATQETKELLPLEKQWIKKALKDLMATLQRARLKELDGSEIYQLRGKEIEQLQQIFNKY